ncbi:hypothetical protein ES705_03576 [subsurface metagenome]
MRTKPEYLQLHDSGELKKRIKEIERICTKCSLCPRNCGVDRTQTVGKCFSPITPVISSAGPHFGEEPPLVGYYGSGTIFFTNCNLNCIYCQNYDISQLHAGQDTSYEALADLMVNMQDRRCHNINLVSPTHQVCSILRALEIAIDKGLNLPLVYNSGGYDSVATLKLLEGIINIYMPDFKYYENETGKRLSNVNDYPAVAKKAITEMHRQVGDLQTDQQGVAYQGLIVRHLILPGYLEESKKIIEFTASISKGIYLNLMDQYRPAYKAAEDPKLTLRLSSTDYNELNTYAVDQGITLEK